MVLRVSLKVNLEYELLASEVAYIELAADARLDTSGLFRFVPETVVTIDGLRFDVSKSLADVQLTQDKLTFLASKSLASAATAPDALRYDVAKKLQDAPTVQDLLAQAVSKSLPPDTYQVPDFTTVEAQKGLSSTIDAPSDFVIRMTHKVLGDTVEVVDEFERLILAIRERDDDQPVTDQMVITAIKPFVDSFSIGDSSTVTAIKNIFDGFAMNDSADAGDGSTFSFSKGVSNVAFVGDAATKVPSKLIADSFGLADGGLVSCQNYADPSYFAEDYVGVSTTF